MRRLILVCLLWAGLHFYVVSRLLSTPLITHIPAWLLIPVVILFGASYIVSLLLEHYGPDGHSGLSHVLEIVGSYWVGVFFLLFSTFLVFDLCTGFGLWLRPQLPMLRTLALIIALLMTIVALVQARRSPEVTEYEVTLDGLPCEADGARGGYRHAYGSPARAWLGECTHGTSLAAGSRRESVASEFSLRFLVFAGRRTKKPRRISVPKIRPFWLGSVPHTCST